MPNHYHFLLRQDGNISISHLMQTVFNSYSKAFNKMYGRTGTLFEGPFKAIHVDREEYLVHLCRYIHRNPLEAGLVQNLPDWPYSNYLEWVDQRNGKLFDADFVESRFECAEEYKRFVLDYQPPKDGLDRFMFD